MALISSGFNGQSFVFHGYLPIKDGRKPFVLQMEQNAQRLKQTQIFMETPYRNQQLFSELLTWLRPATKLCIATDVTLPTEEIRTYSISEWKKKTVEDGKTGYINDFLDEWEKDVSPCLKKKMYLAGARIYYGETEDKFGI